MSDCPTPQRREQLREARKALFKLPRNEWYELAGHPTVYYELRDYREHPLGKDEGIKTARSDINFMFKAFETGQTRPPRGRKTSLVDAPRIATIHEYLDWTVTAEDALGDNELGHLTAIACRRLPRRPLIRACDVIPYHLSPPHVILISEGLAQDFGGFRVIVLLPRFKPGWVAPGTYQEELPRREGELGAPKSALPVIMPNGKPICSATIRAGPGYLEVPFFATQETRRRKGYGRGLLQAIEEVARACKLPYLLLCSTDDPDVKATWRALGFLFTSEEDLHRLGVQEGDLLHMDNTVQMHKPVPQASRWRSVVFVHDQWKQRLYYLPTEETGVKERLRAKQEALARRPSKRPAKKTVAKKTPTKTPTKQKPNGITSR